MRAACPICENPIISIKSRISGLFSGDCGTSVTKMESPMKEKKKKKRESKGDMSVGEVQESGTFKLEPSAAPAKKLETVQSVQIC